MAESTSFETRAIFSNLFSLHIELYNVELLLLILLLLLFFQEVYNVELLKGTQ